jgi:flagellar assembly protein FliH
LCSANPIIAAGDCRIEWADGGVNRDAGAADRVIGEAVARYITARRSFAEAG